MSKNPAISALVRPFTVALLILEEVRESARIAVYSLYFRSIISLAVPLVKVAST